MCSDRIFRRRAANVRSLAPLLGLLLLLGSLPLPATADDRQWRAFDIAAPDRAESGKEAAGSRSSWRAERDAYLEGVRQELKRLEADIEALVVRAKNSTADVRAPLERQIKAFRTQLAGIEAQWREAKKAGQEKWKEIRQAMAKSLKNLHQKIDRESV